MLITLLTLSWDIYSQQLAQLAHDQQDSSYLKLSEVQAALGTSFCMYLHSMMYLGVFPPTTCNIKNHNNFTNSKVFGHSGFDYSINTQSWFFIILFWKTRFRTDFLFRWNFWNLWIIISLDSGIIFFVEFSLYFSYFRETIMIRIRTL